MLAADDLTDDVAAADDDLLEEGEEDDLVEMGLDTVSADLDEEPIEE